MPIDRAPHEFVAETKRRALARQDFLCAMCGSLILPFGSTMVSVAWGETSHAHHRKPIKSGGSGNVENCVIICESCHYIAHEGGNYRHGGEWGRIADFEYFYGAKRR